MINNTLQHVKIDLERDKSYILERHCQINYVCDCPWARKIPYEEYRANWFSNEGQQKGFLSALSESIKDPRTIADIIKTSPDKKIESDQKTESNQKAESAEIVGYLWVPFHGDDPDFIWADVQDIYVEEAYRGTGIAAYLMDYAEKWAKSHGAKVIRSGTGCGNISSQKLHQKMGYYQYRFEYEKVLKED